MSEKVKRLFWVTLGHCFMVLGVLGTILFVFLASSCYAKGSERLHRLLRNSPWIGRAIADWEDRGTIARRTKLFAIGFLLISTLSAVIYLSLFWLKIGICVAALAVALFILTRATAQ